MYAEVTLNANLGHRLVVPEGAVMIAGDSRVVFVDLGQGKLKPVKIKTGQRVEGYIEVLDGLKHGDTVVTSGNFLVAAETKLKAGIDQW
jgi:Cu(I)/Ag(I) efflux system membrane fusion protein